MEKDFATLTATSPAPGDTMTIVGFGLTLEGGQNSETLQKGQVNYFPLPTCQEIFSTLNPIVPDLMLCALGSGVDTYVLLTMLRVL